MLTKQEGIEQISAWTVDITNTSFVNFLSDHWEDVKKLANINVNIILALQKNFQKLIRTKVLSGTNWPQVVEILAIPGINADYAIEYGLLNLNEQLLQDESVLHIFADLVRFANDNTPYFFTNLGLVIIDLQNNLGKLLKEGLLTKDSFSYMAKLITLPHIRVKLIIETILPVLQKTGVLTKANWPHVIDIAASKNSNRYLILALCLPVLQKARLLTETDWPLVKANIFEIVDSFDNGADAFLKHCFPQFQKAGLLTPKNLPSIKKDLTWAINHLNINIFQFADFLKQILNTGWLTESTWLLFKKEIVPIITRTGLNASPIFNAGIPLLVHNGVKNINDFIYPEEILSSKGFYCETQVDILGFLSLLLINPNRIKNPLKNLLTLLMTRTFSGERADIEYIFHSMQRVFDELIQYDLDCETKNLLRRTATLLPFGGGAGLIITIKNQAIELQRLSKDLAIGIRNKIHNFPGKEDVELIQAYIEFLDTTRIDTLKKVCAEHDIKLDIKEFEKNYELLLITRRFAESLLINLQKLWNVRITSLASERKQLNEFQSGNYADDILELNKYLERIENSIAKNDFIATANQIGDLRLKIKAIEDVAEGRLRVRLYYLDLTLSKIEEQSHSDLLKNVDVNSWEACVRTLLNPIIQKTKSMAAEFKGDPSFVKARAEPIKFIETKDLYYVKTAIDYLNYGIQYTTDQNVQEYRDFIRRRFSFEERKIEELASTFYRLGAVFQLDQLVQKFRDLSSVNGEISLNSPIGILVKSIPRPVKTHLRESIRRNLRWYEYE